MRLVVVSHLGLDDRPHWKVLAPPVESRLAGYDGVTVIRPPALRRPTLRRAAPAWLDALRQVRRAEGLFWFQTSARPDLALWALTAARPTARRCAWSIDSWKPSLGKMGAFASAQRMSPLMVGFREARDVLKARRPHLDVEWLPFAANASVFRERDEDRDIFAYWMGRRSEQLDRALTQYCRERGLAYRTDRAVGDDLGRLVSRAKYFVVTPPDVDDPVRTGGLSPMTSRYFEGLAGGARLLGVLPRSGEFGELLPRAAALEVAVDGSDLAARLDADLEAPEPGNRAVSEAQALILQEHTWERRADRIYEALTQDRAMP